MSLENFKTAATGLIGSTTSIGAAAYSLLPHLEAGMRLASVSVGLAVGIATLIKVVRDLRK
jgi:hypothetical protein